MCLHPYFRYFCVYICTHKFACVCVAYTQWLSVVLLLSLFAGASSSITGYILGAQLPAASKPLLSCQAYECFVCDGPNILCVFVR